MVTGTSETGTKNTQTAPEFLKAAVERSQICFIIKEPKPTLQNGQATQPNK